LLIAAQPSRVSAHATDNAISIALGEGKQLAIFKVDEIALRAERRSSPLRAEKPSDPKENIAMSGSRRIAKHRQTVALSPAQTFNHLVRASALDAAQDLLNEPFRRMLVNAVYWALKLEDRIDPKSSVAIVGEYQPLPFKFNGHQPGLTVSDLAK